MSLARQIKPTSHLKSHGVDVARHPGDTDEPRVIIQDGEARLVVRDLASYEAPQEILALLKIIALGNRQIAEGRMLRADEAVKRIRLRRAAGQARRGS